MVLMVYFYAFLYMLFVGGLYDLSVNTLDIRYSVSVKRIFIFLIFIPPFLIAALRYQVGTDYMVYLTEKIPGVLNNWSVGIEPLYRILIKIGAGLGNYQLIFILTHLIIIYFIGESILKESPLFFISVIAFWGTGFFNYSLNIMRQAIAMSIFLYALQFIDKDKKKYFFFIFIACLFHTSAIIYIFYYLIRNINFKNVRSFLWLFVFCILKEPIRVILLFITQRIGKYSQYFGSVLDTNKGGWTFLIINLSIYAVFCFSTYFVKDDDKIQRYISLQFVTTFITVLSSVLPNYERLMYLFMVVQIISIPYVANKLENIIYKFVFLVIIIFLYAFMFYRLFILGNIGETFPYVSIFN